MKKTPKTRSSKSDAEMARIRAEFDRVMNTPSPNPRYGGRTPMEVVKVLLNSPKKKIKPGN
ncbi:MAG: hypothetical protein F4X05_06935 [Rhodothermaceae bacterium]|nr:hypothetical protein [Rhodothermaceae bacterium]